MIQIYICSTAPADKPAAPAVSETAQVATEAPSATTQSTTDAPSQQQSNESVHQQLGKLKVFFFNFVQNNKNMYFNPIFDIQ